MNRRGFRRSAVALLAAVALVTPTACGNSPEAKANTVDVKAGEDASLTTSDKKVRVSVPGESIEGDGQLSAKKLPGSDAAYDIRMGGGAKLNGNASIAFKVPRRSDAPPPMVASAAKAGAVRSPVTGVKNIDGYAHVKTTHFSAWYVTWWEDVLDAMRRLMDRLYSADRQGKAPKCGDEDGARAAGYEVVSSKGARVLWCMGIENRKTVLKVVNARGYAVAVEHSPNAKQIGTSRNDFVTAIANVVPVVPYVRGNKTFVLASGDSATFLVPRSGDARIRVYPDGAAYLVSALAFATETVTTILSRTGLSRSQGAVLKAFKVQQCVGSFYDGATGHIDNVTEAGTYLESALSGMLGCAELAVKDLDLGFFAGPFAAGLVWVIGGIRTALNGIGGAADTALNPEGYRIATRGPVESFSDNPDEWPSGPGFIGPLKAGANVHDLIDAGWAVRAIEGGTCDIHWQLSDSLYPRGFFGDFRAGDPQTLDGVAIGGSTLAGDAPRGSYRTAEGVGLGTTTNKLKQTYNDLVFGRWPIEGGEFVGYVRSTSEGSIMFNVGEPDSQGQSPGDGSRVTHIVVTADTSANAFAPPVGGC